MNLDEIIHPDFSIKETSNIPVPDVSSDYSVQANNVFAMSRVPYARNQLIRANKPGNDDYLYDNYTLQSELAKRYADDISRAYRECNQETYCEVGKLFARVRRDYLGNVTFTPLTNNTIDVCERVRVCDEEMVLIRFQSESHIIRSENEREMWVSVRKFTSDQDTENFLIEHLQIVNPKIFSRSAIKCLRNIFLQKLNDAPRRVFSQYGWCNVNDRNFYFKGVEIDDMEEVPTHWKATTCKEMMERGEAVQIMQNALERNVFLQTELSCVLLISMVSIVLSFAKNACDKVPVVVLYSCSARAFQNIEAIFKYNKNIPTTNNEAICSNSSLQVKYIADDALIVDVVSHKNTSKIIQLSQGCFWGDVKLKSLVYLVKHNFEDVLFSYDWAVEFDDFVIEPALGMAIGRLKYELVQLIEEKKVAVSGLRVDRGDVYSLCETFLTWIGKENVYGEYTKPILDILTRGLKALRDFDGDDLITDILRQKLRLFVKTAEKDSCIEKEQAYYIPTVLFDKICEMLSLKPLAAKKALRLRGGLRVYNSTRQEYTVDVTDPVSGMRTKAVAITKSFLRGGEECERN